MTAFRFSPYPRLFLAMLIISIMAACSPGTQTSQTEKTDMIAEQKIEQIISQLTNTHGEALAARIEKGVKQAAALWRERDGSQDDFEEFCLAHFRGDAAQRHELFEKLSRNYEQLWGHFNQLSLELNKPLHLDVGPIDGVDVLFGSYAPGAHLTEDLFGNRIAFITVLNFPFYSLEEKAANAQNWSRTEWAYARMGDVYTSRMPAHITQESSRVGTDADNYISEYNIVMGQLRDEQNRSLFPENLRLITHWGLRDEIKSNYGDALGGLDKQRMIYQVMLRIISQDIPEKVINNAQYTWNPYSNELWLDGEAIQAEREPDTRYQHLLNSFHSGLSADAYSPNYPTAIERAFNAGLELTQIEVENLFVELVSDPLLIEVGQLISQRLGRDLEPFDIWYDGFKARSAMPEERLDQIVRTRYPDRESFERDLPGIMTRLGWDRRRAEEISSHIVVEASRGAGHAWGATMRSQKSHLRTRIGADGMDYKGYNIAVHEFGHNVEQTISLHDVDYYMMNGVPNTAFTEALAFIFQSRDLELLGIRNSDPMAPHLNALDKLWGSYEIMGVSLVDMMVWQWMYANPQASPAELREQTIAIATDIWNRYYAPVFGVSDSPILAVYSHMISYPLYLSAYPLGRLIEFQLEGMMKGRNLAAESDRVFALGRLIPQEWMREAVGQSISARPMLNAAAEAVKAMK